MGKLLSPFLHTLCVFSVTTVAFERNEEIHCMATCSLSNLALLLRQQLEWVSSIYQRTPLGCSHQSCGWKWILCSCSSTTLLSTSLLVSTLCNSSESLSWKLFFFLVTVCTDLYGTTVSTLRLLRNVMMVICVNQRSKLLHLLCTLSSLPRNPT